MGELTKKRVHWKEYNGDKLIADEDVDILTSADCVTFDDGETMQYKYAQGQFVSPSDTGYKSNLQTDNKSTLVDAINEVKSSTITNETNIESVTDRVSTNETDINRLETRMSTAESDIGTLETRMSTAKSDIDTLETRVTPITLGGTGATSASGALTNLGITATASELNKLDGVTATTTELNYVDGVTSNIQTQINGKANSSHTHSASDITSGTLPLTRGGTGATTASGALTNLGVTATTTELNYVDGVTSNIQTQLDGKANYEIKSSADFNSMTTPGLYTMKSSSTNAPTSGTYHSLIVNKSDSGSYYQQIAIKEGTTDMYIRYGSSSSWSNWKQVSMTDHIQSIDKGGTGATTASEALSALGGASTLLYTAEISAANWNGENAPYTQTVTVNGITSTDTPIVDVVLSSTTSTALNQLEAWNSVSKITTGTNKITVTCLEDKPTTAIPIQLKVVR